MKFDGLAVWKDEIKLVTILDSAGDAVGRRQAMDVSQVTFKIMKDCTVAAVRIRTRTTGHAFMLQMAPVTLKTGDNLVVKPSFTLW